MYQAKCIAEEIQVIEEALRGRGACGGIRRDSASAKDLETLRIDRCRLKGEKEELEEQVEKLKQQQASHLLHGDSGEVRPH